MTARLLRSQWWRHAKIHAYQAEWLNEIARYATSEIPFYKSVTPLRQGQAAQDWLAQFPILSKADIQRAGGLIQSHPSAEKRVYSSRTSGSTGEPTVTLFDEDCWLRTRYALKARRLANFARQPKLRLLALAESVTDDEDVSASFTRSTGLFDVRRIPLSTPAEEAIQRLAAYRPTMIQGYPSILEHLCDTAWNKGLALPHVSHLFTSSELLTIPTRNKLNECFGAKVVDVYGSTEFKEIAVQCKFGRYHVNFESVYVEAIPDPNSGRKRLIITSLLNRAMPLIRYDIGDFGDVASGECECGREGPYIHSLDGRHSELLRFPAGEVLSGFTLTLTIEEFPEIQSYSIVQRSPVNLEVNVFAEPRLSLDRQNELSAALTVQLPDGVDLSVELLDSRPPVGKRVAVRRAFDDPAP